MTVEPSDVYIQDLDKTNKRIDHLEYEEIKSIKDDVSKIQINLSNNNLLTQQSIDTTKQLSETMDSIKETMIKLANGIDMSNKTSSELSGKVSGLEKRFDTLEEKSKFDIGQFVKNNWVNIIVLFGVLAYTILGLNIKF